MKTKKVASRRAGDETRFVLESIRRLVQGLRVAARAAENELGLSGAQLFVLQKLGEGEKMSVNALAEKTCTHQSSVSVVVQRLVEKGLVRRQAAADDRRRVELTLTAGGRKLLAKSPAAAQDRIMAAMKSMVPAGRKQLAQRLGELLDQMGLDTGPAPMIFEEESKPGRSATKRRP
jgi:DNA-binding MarR family transcriptional regulator